MKPVTTLLRENEQLRSLLRDILALEVLTPELHGRADTLLTEQDGRIRNAPFNDPQVRDRARAAQEEKRARFLKRHGDRLLGMQKAGKTLQEIAQALNSDGIATISGVPWSRGTVKNMLDRMASE